MAVSFLVIFLLRKYGDSSLGLGVGVTQCASQRLINVVSQRITHEGRCVLQYFAVLQRSTKSTVLAIVVGRERIGLLQVKIYILACHLIQHLDVAHGMGVRVDGIVCQNTVGSCRPALESGLCSVVTP